MSLNTNPDNLRLLVGKKLRQARVDRGVSQQQLADKMKTNRVTISSYERGRLRITIQFLLHICEILEKPIYYFVEENDEIKEKYEQQLRKNTSFYNLSDNLEFSMELSIKNYLRSRCKESEVNEKLDKVLSFINNVCCED